MGFGQGFSRCAGVLGEGKDIKWQVTKSQSLLDVLSSNQLKLSGCSSSVAVPPISSSDPMLSFHIRWPQVSEDLIAIFLFFTR